MISELETKNGAEIAIVTVEKTSSYPSPKAFTTKLFNYWGIGVGLLMAIMWSALYSASHSLSSNTKHSKNLSPTPETSSRESSVRKSTSSFPFGID